MVKRLITQLQQSIMGGAIIIGAASIVSRVLGLLRDRLFTSTFGADQLLDSYFTAFKIPDFIFNILVLGALSASFVPLYIEYRTKKGREEAMHVANTVLNMLVIGMVALAILAYVFNPQLIQWLAYDDSAAQQQQIVLFSRIMLVSLVLFGISNVIAGILHAEKRFFVYAIAPIFYNIGIITGILVLYPLIGDVGLALGVVLGAALHVLVQLPTAVKQGFHFHPVIDVRHPGVRTLLRLLPPRAFALGLAQCNIIILFAIASTLSTGDRAIWQFADNLQNFPINIFGVSLALSAFPVFSEALAAQKGDQFKKVFSENFRRILFFIIPISIATLLLRAQIVRLVYGAGNFDWNDTILTAQTLGVFALSMFAQGTIPLLARSFFAYQDTKTPVVISVFSLLCTMIGAVVLVEPFGLLGLALAYSIGMVLQMLLLLAALRIRHGDLDDDYIISSTWKIVMVSLLMGIVIHGLKYVVAPMVDMHTFLGVFTQTVVSLLGGAAVYITIASRFHFAEATVIKNRALSMLRLVRRFW